MYKQESKLYVFQLSQYLHYAFHFLFLMNPQVKGIPKKWKSVKEFSQQ